MDERLDLSNEPAFPMMFSPNDGFAEPTWTEGLTRRELFAAMAMQGLLAGGMHIDDFGGVATRAWHHADALIAKSGEVYGGAER